HFQKSRGRSRRALLEPGNRLTERFPARLAIGGLEFRYLEPAQKRIGTNTGGFGGFLHVPLSEQRHDRLFLLAPEFSAGSLHFPPISTMWTDLPSSLFNAELPSVCLPPDIAVPSPTSILFTILLLVWRT